MDPPVQLPRCKAVGRQNVAGRSGGKSRDAQSRWQQPATNILIGSGGTGGGLYNSTANYSFNLAPDMIAKAVFEPAPGQHYELFGIASFYRDRIYPTGATPYNSTVVGGGGGASARATVLHKKLVIGLKGLYGEGVGRYGNAQLGDVTIRPNGTLSPIHGFSALSTVELNPNKRLNIYFNYGGDYLGRDYTISGGKQVGYGVYTADMSGCKIEPASTAAFPASDPSTPGNATNGCKNKIKTWRSSQPVTGSIFTTGPRAL